MSTLFSSLLNAKEQRRKGAKTLFLLQSTQRVLIFLNASICLILSVCSVLSVVKIKSLRLCAFAPLRLIMFTAVLFSSALTAEEPWGTDADLLCPCKPPCEKPLTFTGYVAKGIILFHQRVISEADGPRSHFRPTSSQYMLDAIHTHGFLVGYAMGCDRLMRENCERWIYPIITAENGTLVKYDPVKPACCR